MGVAESGTEGRYRPQLRFVSHPRGGKRSLDLASRGTDLELVHQRGSAHRHPCCPPLPRPAGGCVQSRPQRCTLVTEAWSPLCTKPRPVVT